MKKILFFLIVMLIPACAAFSQENTADINRTLSDAVTVSDISAAKVALANGADANGDNKNGIPVFEKAVEIDNVEMVELLLKTGADINKMRKHARRNL